MFNEDNTIEKMIIDTLSQRGWRYVAPDDLGRSLSDVLVEPMVKDALIRLNPVIAEDHSRADLVIRKLRTVILSTQEHDLVTQNETFKRLLFEDNSFPFGEGSRQISIDYFGMGSDDRLRLNDYVITNQWAYPSEANGKRLDIVLLVNGFPLVIGELKTPVRNSVSWLDGAMDIAAYERSIPQMFVPNVLNFSTEGKAFRYGSVKMPVSMWGPWHTTDDKMEGTLADVQRSIESMLTPKVVMDIFRSFTIFATDKKHRKYKIIARYQQYEGANLIVERVRKGRPKKGLIWHFQGSGKSLLMVFAAQKLRMLEELKNPTVVIVDDRIDLETQITATFNASDIPNLQSARSKDELIDFFKKDIRKILITTIYKFGEVNGTLNERDNIIVMVDEAHRTQEGNLGAKMREALPNAFFFGLTGTPINRTDKNTFNTFGAIEEDVKGYMSLYSFSDSIRDNATLPLHFETVPIELHIDQEFIDTAFDELTKGLEEGDKAELSKRVRMEAIMKSPERVKKICAHIVQHYREKVFPNRFKGQIVCYDRECCLMYKQELDRLIGPESSTIVMDTNNDKAGKYAAYRRDRDAEARVLDEFRDPENPLKLLIVTSKLLTGFDAPILQVMYLDKPMKDHTLLQAICRTNRKYEDAKTHGLIVDYIGIFDNIARALSFDEKAVRQVITNIAEVKQKLPELLRKCLEYFNGVDRTVEGWEGLLAAQECLPDDNTRDSFAADYRVLNKAWNALSPDEALTPYQAEYRWLSKVYESVKPADNRGALVWAALGPKTLELVHQSINIPDKPIGGEGIDIFLTPELIDEFFDGDKGGADKPKVLEIKLIARLAKHKDDPKFVRLGERLEALRERHAQGLVTSVEFLKLLLDIAKDTLQAEKEVPQKEPSKDEQAQAALTELFNSVRNAETPVIVERVVKDIDDVVKIVRFPSWQDTSEGRRKVRQSVRNIIYNKYKIKDDDVFEKAYKYIEMYY